jgi:uncharacterized membrane protein
MGWIQSSSYAYPVLESVHIVGIALLFGSLVMFELRVLGAGAALDVQGLGRLALPVALTGFGIAATTGGVMFASQAGELLGNRAFLLKMGLVVLAGLNALGFHWRGGSRRRDALARAQTALSLGLWLAVIICGRWIAYA